MIFGGYGRKSKLHGEVFYPCTNCSELNAFGLVESYNYGQLYGVRLAKYKTQRMLMCSKCRNGYELDKDQWERAALEAKNLKRLLDTLTMKEMAQSAVLLGQTLFGTKAGQGIRQLLWQELDEDPPLELEDARDQAQRALVASSAADDVKACPDCAEAVRAAARKCRFCGYEFDKDHVESATFGGQVSLLRPPASPAGTN
jgi:hypothetical protein